MSSKALGIINERIVRDCELFEGKLCDVLNVVNDLIEKYGEQAYVGYDLLEDPWSNTYELQYQISYHRKETEEERDSRLAQAVADKLAAEDARYEAERKEYERLREKFEGVQP